MAQGLTRDFTLPAPAGAGQVLTATGGANGNYVWAAPGAIAYAAAYVSTSASTGISNGTTATISFTGADIHSTAGMWNASAPSRVTVTAAGWYQLSASVKFSASTSNSRRLFIVLNGTTVATGTSPAPADFNDPFVDVSLGLYLSVGDVVTLQVLANANGVTVTSAQLSVVALTPVAASGAWTALTPASGIGALSGNPPQYRLNGDVVELRGYFSGVSGSANAAVLLATLPAGYRPTVANAEVGLNASSSSAVQILINTDGAVTCYSPGTLGSVLISVAGIRYSITA